LRSTRSITTGRRIRPARILATGAVALAAIATPLAWSQIVGATNAGPLPNHTSPSFDEIQFNQDTSQNGTYASFVPGANSHAPVSSGSWSESSNNGGGCSSGITYTHSGQSTAALMNLSAINYGGTGAASVGTFKYRTGVCISNSGGDQAIDPNASLVFSLNPTQSSPINTAVIGSGRIFADARVWVARADKNTDKASVTLTEWLKSAGGTEQQVGSQVFMVGQGSPVTLDSSCPGSVVSDSAQTFSFDNSCTGSAPTSGFDQIEVRNTSTTADSVAIVGGASFAPVFYLQNELCVGGHVSQSSGTDNFGANATITLVSVPSGSPTCKSYSQFAVGGDTAALGSKFVEFDATPLAGSHFTVHVDWGDASYCTPDGENGVPACAPTEVVINGSPETPQTYCPVAGFPNVTTGMTVSGTGIPANTTVTSLSSTGTAATLSQNAAADGTVNLTFTSGSTTTQVVNVTTSAGSRTVTVPALCTTSKQFSYPSVNGTTYTDIVENWDGLTDWRLQW
jgi:hypothetical protein